MAHRARGAARKYLLTLLSSSVQHTELRLNVLIGEQKHDIGGFCVLARVGQPTGLGPWGDSGGDAYCV